MIPLIMRFVKSVAKLLLPVVLVVLVVNIVMMSGIFVNKDRTTVYVQQVYKRFNYDSVSSSDANQSSSYNDAKGENVNKIKGDAEPSQVDQDQKSGNDHSPPKASKDGESKEKDEPMRDEGVDNMINRLKKTTLFDSHFWNVSLAYLAKTLGQAARMSGKKLSGYENMHSSKKLSNWRKVHRNIRQFSLYDPADPAVDALLHDMATLPIDEIDENDGGTELKMILVFSDGGRAVFKPMRYARDVGTSENHYIFDDLERHYAEIAASHLDRLLGFYRVPLTIGRRLNLTEIEDMTPESIRKTFFRSPAGNICFYGGCDYFCDSHHAFCGKPDIIEGSVMSYLPSRNIAQRRSWYQPWRRSYSRRRKAQWEHDDKFCRAIKKEAPFNNGKLLLDMIDAHTFDFLTGNKDRHSFVTFKEYGNYSFPILYDNGRGFGRQEYDAMSILAPLRQCCMIRKSTFLKYVKLYEGPEKLSTLMEKSLESDPVSPVLLPGHLSSLDRRLVKILQIVAKCIQTTVPYTKVIISDKF